MHSAQCGGFHFCLPLFFNCPIVKLQCHFIHDRHFYSRPQERVFQSLMKPPACKKAHRTHARARPLQEDMFHQRRIKKPSSTRLECLLCGGNGGNGLATSSAVSFSAGQGALLLLGKRSVSAARLFLVKSLFFVLGLSGKA